MDFRHNVVLNVSNNGEMCFLSDVRIYWIQIRETARLVNLIMTRSPRCNGVRLQNCNK